MTPGQIYQAWLAVVFVLMAAGMARYFWLQHKADEEEAEADKRRAARIQRMEFSYEEAPEPRAGFGGSDWRDAGAPLRRGPQERNR